MSEEEGCSLTDYQMLQSEHRRNRRHIETIIPVLLFVFFTFASSVHHPPTSKLHVFMRIDASSLCEHTTVGGLTLD